MKRNFFGLLKALVKVSPVFGGLFVMALFFAAVIGWVLNLIKFMQDVVAPNAELTLEIAVRALGIFIGFLGAVLGYL